MNILTRYGCLQSSADRVIRGRLDMPSRLSVTDGGLVAVLGVFGRSFIVIAARGAGDCNALRRRCHGDQETTRLYASLLTGRSRTLDA